jgi:hypothetical protein
MLAEFMDSAPMAVVMAKLLIVLISWKIWGQGSQKFGNLGSGLALRHFPIKSKEPSL